MTSKQGYKAILATCAGLAFALAAGELQAADELQAWSGISAGELAAQRGGAAENNATQTATNVLISAGDVSGGALALGHHAINNNRFTINAINTGNNVVMLNQLTVDVQITNY